MSHERFFLFLDFLKSRVYFLRHVDSVTQNIISPFQLFRFLKLADSGLSALYNQLLDFRGDWVLQNNDSSLDALEHVARMQQRRGQNDSARALFLWKPINALEISLAE